MSLYNSVASKLEEDGDINHLYRFQGLKSFSYFDIQGKKFVFSDKYVYFSSSLSHHKYFILHRIKQFLNHIILADSKYKVCRSSLYSNYKYSEIVNTIVHDPRIVSLSSVDFACDSNYYSLIQDNYYNNDTWKQKGVIERVDTSVHNGGYGISGEWLFLLENMLFFSSVIDISADEILMLLNNMRNLGSINNINNVDFLFHNSNYHINPQIYNDFAKYEIMNCLEQIIDNGLCHKSSELYNNPTKTIKTVVADYQKKRVKTLKLIDSSYRLRIND